MKTATIIKPLYIAAVLLLMSSLHASNGAHLHATSSSNVEKESHLFFTENKGQWESSTAFKARLTPGYIDFNQDHFHVVFYNENIHEMMHQPNRTVSIHISGHAFNIRFIGASDQVQFVKKGATSFYYNYFLGNDSSRWASQVYSYNTIRYKNIYSGIDIEIQGNDDKITYDYYIAPGANPAQIKVRYEGVDQLQVKNGVLYYQTTACKVSESKPYAYQIVQGKKQEVKCRYVLQNNEVFFEFPNGYNLQYELVIDPTLVFSSYTGSTADNFGFTATYDNSGNLYAGGNVFSGGYPLVGAFMTSFMGGTFDMGISKFNATGTALLYSTYLGGNGDDRPHSLIVDNSDNLYVYGSSNSSDYPTVAAFDPSYNGLHDIVISRFNASGIALLTSTYIGGSGGDGFIDGHALVKNYSDESRGEIFIDIAGNVYVVSYTNSSNFPVTPGVIQSTLRGGIDGVVMKFNAAISSRFFSTYLGGSSNDVCNSVKVDSLGNIFVAGGTASNDFPVVAGSFDNSFNGFIDGYLMKLNNSGTVRLAGTFLGTANYDQAYFIDLDRFGNVYAMGQTEGTYPVVAAVYSNAGGRQFIHKLDNNLSATIMSTVFGSGTNINISPTAFLVDRCDNIYVSGWGGNVNSGFAGGATTGLRVTADAYQSTTDGSDFYFIVLERNALGLLYATYFGGNASTGEHVDGGTSRFDREGVIYEAICAGCGGNSLFPTTPGVWSNTNNSSNCNLAALKFEMNLAGTNVEVNASPRATGCVPLTVNFTSVLTNVRTVQWYFGDGGTSTVRNPTHTYMDTGTFTVMLVGIDSTSCNIADTAYLTVFVDDDSVTANFMPNLIVDCYTRRLFAYTSNYPTTAYTWNISDGFTSSNDTIIHTLPAPGTYTISLKVEDPNSCNGLQLVTRNITIEPIVNINVALSDTAGCFPLTINFNNTTASPRSYLWDFGDGDTSTIKSPTHTYTEGGVYTVTLYFIDTTTCNNTDTFQATITVYNDTVTPLFDINRIFYGCDSVGVQVQSFNTDADRVWWYFGDGTVSNSLSDFHIYRDSGLYQIIYVVLDSSKRCRIIDTVNEYVSLDPLDAVFTVSDTNACVPATILFTDASPFVLSTNYWSFGDGTWDTGRVVTHTYTAVDTWSIIHIIIDSSVCNFADTAYGSIRTRNDSSVASFTSTVLNNCDSALIISFTNTSINALQFEWDFGDGTGSTLANPTHTWTLPGTYTVRMISIDTTRCHPRDTAYTTVRLRPNAIADFEMLPVACSGVGVQLNNLSNPNAQFIWYFSDGDTSYTFEPFHIFTDPGTYTVTMIIYDTSACDLFDTVEQSISILAFPIANFAMDRDSFYYAEPIQFTNQSQNFTDVIWYFGNGDSSTTENPLYTYAQIHEQQPCIVAYIEGTSCADTFCRDIYINFEPRIGVPNAFTPNGDGINDVIRVEGAGIIELQFMIFNRWGEKVFETRDQAVGWDGVYKAQMQEMEVFAYTVKARFLDDTRKVLTGNITLLK